MSHNSGRSLPFAPGNDEHESGHVATARGERGPRVAGAGEPIEHPRGGACAGTAVRCRKELER